MTDLAHARVPSAKLVLPALITCNVVIMIAVLIYKIFKHYPHLEYAQLLATYQFGVVRRALIGQLWSFFRDQVPATDVFVLGFVLILITIAVFVFVFASAFRFSSESMPLFVYMAGSPFLFKNFVFSIGYFDVLGCLSALIALSLPLNALFLPIVGAICVFLLFVHHLHFLLYIPTIGLIVILRQRASGTWNSRFLVQVFGLALVIAAVFVLLTFYIRLPVTSEIFLQSLRDRALDPVSPHVLQLWYSTIAEEVQHTMITMPKNLKRVPIYAALILLHAPLIAYFSRMVRLLDKRIDFLLVISGLVVVTMGYIAICMVIFDYSRWVSNWAVCMMLIMVAVRYLPARERIANPIPLTPRNTVLAAIVTLIPRVGITLPF